MFADYKTDKLLMMLVLINMQEIIIIEKKLYFEMWSVTILTVALTDVCSVWKLEFLMNLITALSPQCMGTNGAIWLATGVLLYVLCQNEGFLNNHLLPDIVIIYWKASDASIQPVQKILYYVFILALMLQDV